VSLIRLPRPIGRHAVGTIAAIRAAYGEAVTIWYPAEHGVRGPRAPYRGLERSGSHRARLLRALIRTNAAVGVPAARGQHPLLLYVPSWGGQRGENTMLAEYLASSGFVVAALDDSQPGGPPDFSSAAALTDTQRRADEKVLVAAARSSQVLTELLESSSMLNAAFALNIDRERVGIFGFSFGGAVAAETARRDARIRAAANLDGWLFADAAAHGVPKPFLIIGTGAPERAEQSQRPGSAAPPSLEQQFDAQNERQIVAGFDRCGGYFVSIDGTRHASFCDTALLPSLRRSPAAGPIGGKRARHIVSTYLLQFFEQYVQGRTTPLFAPHDASSHVRHTPVDPAIRRRCWHSPRA